MRRPLGVQERCASAASCCRADHVYNPPRCVPLVATRMRFASGGHPADCPRTHNYCCDAHTGQKKGGQSLLGGLDIKVSRNFFGAQVRCCVCSLPVVVLISAGAHACVSRRLVWGDPRDATDRSRTADGPLRWRPASTRPGTLLVVGTWNDQSQPGNRSTMLAGK